MMEPTDSSASKGASGPASAESLAVSLLLAGYIVRITKVSGLGRTSHGGTVLRQGNLLQNPTRATAFTAVIDRRSGNSEWRLVLKVFHGVPRDITVLGGRRETSIQVPPQPCIEPIQLSPRASDFEWLRKLLSDRYDGMAVPLLPEKKVIGHQGADFIQVRSPLVAPGCR